MKHIILGWLYAINFFYIIAYFYFRGEKIETMISDIRDHQNDEEKEYSYIQHYYDAINRPFAGYRKLFMILVYTPVVFSELWLYVSEEDFSRYAILYILVSSFALHFFHLYEKHVFDTLLEESKRNKQIDSLQKENQKLLLCLLSLRYFLL